MVRRAPESAQLMTALPSAKSRRQQGPIVIRDVGKVAAPIDKASRDRARLHNPCGRRGPDPGRIGHFFPGGTVEAFDVWLELQGPMPTDA